MTFLDEREHILRVTFRPYRSTSGVILQNESGLLSELEILESNHFSTNLDVEQPNFFGPHGSKEYT